MNTICYPPTISADYLFSSVLFTGSAVYQGQSPLNLLKCWVFKCVITGHVLVPSILMHFPGCGPYDLWAMTWKASYIIIQHQWTATFVLSTKKWYCPCLFFSVIYSLSEVSPMHRINNFDISVCLKSRLGIGLYQVSYVFYA